MWCPSQLHLWEVHFDVAPAGGGPGTLGAQYARLVATHADAHASRAHFVDLVLGALRIRFREVAQAVAFAQRLHQTATTLFVQGRRGKGGGHVDKGAHVSMTVDAIERK